MNAELCEVAPWLLKFKNENEKLLEPIGRLCQIIPLEVPRHLPMWIVWGTCQFDDVNPGTSYQSKSTSSDTTTSEGHALYTDKPFINCKHIIPKKAELTTPQLPITPKYMRAYPCSPNRSSLLVDLMPYLRPRGWNTWRMRNWRMKENTIT
jgi:hypothetical protein